MNNTPFICKTAVILTLLMASQISQPIASHSATHKRTHAARRHLQPQPSVKLESLCKLTAFAHELPAKPGTPAIPKAGYRSSFELGAIVRTSKTGTAWNLLGFKMQHVEFRGKQQSSSQQCVLTVEEAKGLSRAIGDMLANSARWRDRDMGYRGSAFATRSGLELQFTQNENRMQSAFAACNPGSKSKFQFEGMRQLAQLKQSIDGRLLAWHVAQVAGRYISDQQADVDMVAAR